MDRTLEVQAKQPESMKPNPAFADIDATEQKRLNAEPTVGELFEVIAIMGKKVLLRREGSDNAWEAKVLR